MKLQMVIQRSLCLLVSVSLSLGGASFSAHGQDRGQPINISFGQPNIWSLEQVHYLLAHPLLTV
jgi:hypothetical protein